MDVPRKAPRRRLLADTTPLRENPAFRRLWLGLSAAAVGQQLAVVAIGLQVYDLTRSTFAVGLVGLCALVPLVVLGLYGGSLVDAHDRRRVALAASALLWAVSLATLAQAVLGARSPLLLYALVALQSAGFAVSTPARSAIVAVLVPARQLPAANALLGVTSSVAMTLGPVVAGAVVATAGFAWAYAIDAVTYLAALHALRRLPPLPPEGARAHRAGLASVAEGLRYLGTRPTVRMTFVVDLAAMVLAMPRVLFPAVGAVLLGGGAATVGLLTAAIAAGSLLAGLLSGPLGAVRRQGAAVVVAICCWGLAVAAFGAAVGVLPGLLGRGAALAAALLLLAVAGAADAVSSVFRQTILQSATPDALRGRLQGVFIVVVAGGPRLGDLLLGAGGDLLGEAVAAAAGGLLCVVVVLVLARAQRSFVRYDALDPVP